jgi:hypothetical protein
MAYGVIEIVVLQPGERADELLGVIAAVRGLEHLPTSEDGLFWLSSGNVDDELAAIDDALDAAGDAERLHVRPVRRL